MAVCTLQGSRTLQRYSLQASSSCTRDLSCGLKPPLQSYSGAQTPLSCQSTVLSMMRSVFLALCVGCCVWPAGAPPAPRCDLQNNTSSPPHYRHPPQNNSRQAHLAAVQLVSIIKLCQTLRCELIAAVNDPPVGLHQHCRAQVLVTVPPVAGAARAAGAGKHTAAGTFSMKHQVLVRLMLLGHKKHTATGTPPVNISGCQRWEERLFKTCAQHIPLPATCTQGALIQPIQLACRTTPPFLKHQEAHPPLWPHDLHLAQN